MHGGEVGDPVARDQRARLGLVGRLTQEEDDLVHAAGRQVDRGLQGRARIEAGAEALRQRQVGAERGGIVHAAVAADELAAIARPRGLTAGEVGEGHAASVMEVPFVAREDRAGLAVALGDDRGAEAPRARPRTHST